MDGLDASLAGQEIQKGFRIHKRPWRTWRVDCGRSNRNRFRFYFFSFRNTPLSLVFRAYVCKKELKIDRFASVARRGILTEIATQTDSTVVDP